MILFNSHRRLALNFHFEAVDYGIHRNVQMGTVSQEHGHNADAWWVVLSWYHSETYNNI